MAAGKTTSITEGLLAQVLFETEQEILKNPGYENTGEVFNTATYLLSESFRHLMEVMASFPNYGVIGGIPKEVVDSVSDSPYSSLDEEQKAEVDNRGRILVRLLSDPPARILILGLIEAYRLLEGERGEEIPQDAK